MNPLKDQKSLDIVDYADSLTDPEMRKVMFEVVKNSHQVHILPLSQVANMMFIYLESSSEEG